MFVVGDRDRRLGGLVLIRACSLEFDSCLSTAKIACWLLGFPPSSMGTLGGRIVGGRRRAAIGAGRDR